MEHFQLDGDESWSCEYRRKKLFWFLSCVTKNTFKRGHTLYAVTPVIQIDKEIEFIGSGFPSIVTFTPLFQLSASRRRNLDREIFSSSKY
jgi:hypothetical protein